MSDLSAQPGYADISYLRTVGAILEQWKRRSYALMGAEASRVLLDMGCGPGIDTCALAAIVGPSGRIEGVDHDSAMVAEAEQNAAAAGVGAWVRHQQADATALPFPDETFDACRSERVFQHLVDPAAALAEMARVTKSGGRIVVMDADWGTFSFDCPHIDIERKLARMNSDWNRNGYSGRTLYRLFKRQGLEVLAIEGSTTQLTDFDTLDNMVGLTEGAQEAMNRGIITADELQRWNDWVATVRAEDICFGSVSGFIVAGRKPR
jgi:ubiquinone/menaquinone biosynthesis C-methylase UbiE